MKEWMNGRFINVRVICEGRAYHAYDQASQKDVFLKCWAKEDACALNEITMLTGIDSPYTPRFLCTFEEEDRRYLAEEWIEGTTLADFISEQGALLPVTCLEIAKALCDAVSFLHWNRQGAIVFLDLKPSNILLRGSPESGDFSVTLVDYEAALRLGGTPMQDDAQIRGTRRLGSCYYTAPEVIFAKPYMTSDIYSIGVILYVMLKGVEGYPNPDQLKGGMASVVRRCVDPNPQKRYVDVSELKEALIQEKQRIHRRKRKSLEVVCTKEETLPVFKQEERKLLHYRKCSVMVDCNTCFASEMAHVASESLGLSTAVFAASKKGQRNLEYYFLNLNQMCELVSEDYYPFLFDHQSLYLKSKGEWTERGLLHACSDQLYIGSSKLQMELPLRTSDDFNRFFDWCQANFDLVLFATERQDDPADIDQMMRYCNCIVTTPLSNIEDLEAYRDYYVSLAGSKRVILSKVRFVAWDYRESSGLSPARFAEIVGSDRYLGEVTHSESRIRKKNRMPLPCESRSVQEEQLQYETIIERLIG